MLWVSADGLRVVDDKTKVSTALSLYLLNFMRKQEITRQTGTF